MPTLDVIQKEHPDIEFKLFDDNKYPELGKILHIYFKGKSVSTSFADIERLDINSFNDRILKPCLNAIENVIKRSNQNA